MAREINSTEELSHILSLKDNDITQSLIRKFFCAKGGRVLYTTSDYFILPKNTCCNNSKSGYTTIGIYIFNRFIIEPRFSEIFGYINKSVTGDVLKDIEAKLSEYLYKDKITSDDYVDYLDRIQWLSGNESVALLNPSLSPALLKPPEGLDELKQELIEKYKDKIEQGDPYIAVQMEKELVEYARNKLKDEPGYENFSSNAKIEFHNNYKTMVIMKGPMSNSASGDYDILTSNYNDGISKKEYASFADSSVVGAYSRSTSVAVGGYLAKRSNQTLNVVMAQEKNSDCKTRKYLIIKIDPKFKDEYLYRYIKEGEKHILLTDDNIDKYMNKEVYMRSPLFCHEPEPFYCNMCLGEQPYLIDLKNFGLAVARLSNTLLNLKLKKFHDLTVKTSKVDMSKVFYFRDKKSSDRIEAK